MESEDKIKGSNIGIHADTWCRLHRIISPVATESTLWTGIPITLYFDGENWICDLVDVEAALLEGKLKSEV